MPDSQNRFVTRSPNMTQARAALVTIISANITATIPDVRCNSAL